MSRFEKRLHDAADGPVGFDHRDVSRRVVRRRRNRLIGAGLAAFVVVAGVVGVTVAGGGDDDDDDRLEVAGSGDGAVTVEELVADRWVVFAYSEVIVGPDSPPVLEFRESGELFGQDVCTPIVGTWELEGSHLEVDLGDVEQLSCIGEDAGLAELLEAGPTVGRFDAVVGSLRLSSGSDFLAFERFDRMGVIPAPADLVGEWRSTLGDRRGGVSFDADGSGAAVLAEKDGTPECVGEFHWLLEGDLVRVTGLDQGVSCGDGSVGGGPAVMSLREDPRVRLRGERLWLSSDLGVESLVPAGS